MTEQQPVYRAYTIVERQKDTPFWLNIGVAFSHKDTKGLNVILQALPLDGKLVLRLSTEGPPDENGLDNGSKTRRRAQTSEQA